MNTSKKMIDALVKHVTPNSRVLEPSAGEGDLVEGLLSKTSNISAVELNLEKYLILENRFPGKVITMRMSIFAVSPEHIYEHVVAVPPYKDNQDCEHIMQMYKLIKKGGSVITFTLPTWITGMYTNQRKFREWLVDKDYELKIFEEPESYLGCPKMLLIIRK